MNEWIIFAASGDTGEEAFLITKRPLCFIIFGDIFYNSMGIPLSTRAAHYHYSDVTGTWVSFPSQGPLMHKCVSIWRNYHAMISGDSTLKIHRNHSGDGLSQWEAPSKYNVVFHWHIPRTIPHTLFPTDASMDQLSGCTVELLHGDTLQWRHNGRDSVSNHSPHHCLLNRLFRCRSKKTSKLRVAGLYVGNSQGTGEFPA